MDLEARPYRSFVAVAEELSFTRAATKLNISQPALSAQIRELERRLGFSLFNRTSRHVELSSEGRLFLPNARRIVREMGVIDRAARDIQSTDLRIGAALQTELIPERRSLIEDFMAAAPSVQLHVINDHAARLATRLERREVDLVITLAPLQGVRPDPSEEMGRPGFERLILCEKSIDILFPREHPLARAPVSAGALKDLPIAAPNRFHGVALSEAIADRFAEIGAVFVRPPEGHGLAVERYGEVMRTAAVSLNWFDQPAAGTTCIRRSVTDLNLTTGLVLIHRSGDQRPAAEQFWNAAQSRIASGDFGQRPVSP